MDHSRYASKRTCKQIYVQTCKHANMQTNIPTYLYPYIIYTYAYIHLYLYLCAWVHATVRHRSLVRADVQWGLSSSQGAASVVSLSVDRQHAACRHRLRHGNSHRRGRWSGYRTVVCLWGTMHRGKRAGQSSITGHGQQSLHGRQHGGMGSSCAQCTRESAIQLWVLHVSSLCCGHHGTLHVCMYVCMMHLIDACMYACR